MSEKFRPRRESKMDDGQRWAVSLIEENPFLLLVMPVGRGKTVTLLTAVRGCDNEPKQWTRTGVAYSTGRRLTAFIRWCFMNPADPREVDSEEGAFFMSTPPDPFKPSEFGHLRNGECVAQPCLPKLHVNVPTPHSCD